MKREKNCYINTGIYFKEHNPFDISFRAEKELKKIFLKIESIFKKEFEGINIFDILRYSLAWRIFPVIRDEIFYKEVKDKELKKNFNIVKERERFIKYKFPFKIFKSFLSFFIFLVLRKRRKIKVISTIPIKDNFNLLTFSFKFFLKKRDSFYFPRHLFFIKSSYLYYINSRKLLKKLFYKIPFRIREKYREIFSYYLFYRLPFLLSYIPFFKKEFKKIDYFITQEDVTKIPVILSLIFKNLYTVQHGHLWKKHTIAMGDFGFFPPKGKKIFVWGKEFKERYIERKVNEERIFITGSPFHVNLLKRKRKFEKIKGRVLWITQQSKGMEDEGIYLFSKFLQGFIIALSERRDLFLIIKARPRENLKIYNSLLKRFKINNYRILKENLWDEVEKAEIVFSSFSTAIYEALLLRKSVVCVFPESLPLPFPYEILKIPYTDKPQKIAYYILNPPEIEFDKEKIKLFFENYDNPDNVFMKIEKHLK